MKFLFRKLFDKLASIEAGLISILMVLLFAIFTILFLSIWLAMYIGDNIGSRANGFGIIAASFFILFIIIAIARKSSIKPFFEQSIKDKRED